MNEITNARIIRTTLTDNASKNVLKSVLGQLSDGIWENSRYMENFWPYVEIEMLDGHVCFVIEKKSYIVGTRSSNGFKMRDDAWVKGWFAEKIKAVVKEEKKYDPEKGIKFNGKCDVSLEYMSDYDDFKNEIKVSDAYKTYIALKG